MRALLAVLLLAGCQTAHDYVVRGPCQVEQQKTWGLISLRIDCGKGGSAEHQKDIDGKISSGVSAGDT